MICGRGICFWIRFGGRLRIKWEAAAFRLPLLFVTMLVAYALTGSATALTLTGVSQL